MTPIRLGQGARMALAVVRAYQRYLSPLKPPTCIFTPSCSQYMIEAIQTHGALRGLWLGITRLARCGPWSQGGYDPVPDPVDKQTHE